MLHNDFEVIVYVGEFQEFDCGEETQVKIPEYKKGSVRAEDMFYWTCAQFRGIAMVVAVNGTQCTVKKWN